MFRKFLDFLKQIFLKQLIHHLLHFLGCFGIVDIVLNSFHGVIQKVYLSRERGSGVVGSSGGGGAGGIRM